MKWMTSNLLIVLILGILLFFGSFVRARIWADTPNWIIFGIGAALLLASFVGAVQVVRGPPDHGEIVDEEEHDGQPPEIPDSALERLRLAWDSDSVADWPAAETLAEISEIAYQPPFEAEKSFQEKGFSEVMPVVQGSMIGYVISGQDLTVVVFRGTDFSEISDWIANLGTSAIDIGHGRVHSGFYNAYQSMKSQVDAILKERDTTYLWVTGHSLGGALALLCAYDLAEVEQQVLKGVVTFGQPFVARQQFADHINSILVGRYARFVNRSDMVSRIPPSYVPCGSLVWFTDRGVRRSKVLRVLFGESATDDALPREIRALSLESDAEVTPMSGAEFKALQARLKAQGTTVERLPEGTPITAQAAAPPFIEDHYMWAYIEQVRGLVRAEE